MKVISSMSRLARWWGRVDRLTGAGVHEGGGTGSGDGGGRGGPDDVDDVPEADGWAGRDESGAEVVPGVIGWRRRRNRRLRTKIRPLIVLIKYLRNGPMSTTTPYISQSLEVGFWIATFEPIVISGRCLAFLL